MTLKVPKTKTQFVCQSCGYISLRWIGRCSECNSWNSFIEEKSIPKKGQRYNSGNTPASPISLKNVVFDNHQRVQVRSEEFNRVLGGGIVPGSLILIGGDPGIGKSTLMLQESVAIARKDFTVLYVTGEESTQQTKLRAQRLAVDSEYLYILSETDFNNIAENIEKLNPALIVVDSIQTVYQSGLESSPGSISQVRECALGFTNIAKSKNIPIFLIGHVTKEGYFAGPKVLEHMVDVLLQFEGDREHYYRLLRAVKNRFGSTREIGIFEMRETGLVDVPNPSALFLEQRKDNVSGSAVICTMEGTRPFLIEIQALVTTSNYGLPQRTATGIDSKRLSLLLAVLEKRVGLNLGTFDVFVNAAGGARVEDPTGDLGILAAIASSFQDRVVDPEAIILGEIGLGGELRAVPQIDKRLDEAAKLGFKKAVIPKFNTKGLNKNCSLKIASADKAEEALEEILH